MIKLNDDSIYVGEIKQLLKNFNLPRCKVYRSEDKFVEGNHYIKDGQICIYKDGKFEREDLYVYNRAYLNLTTNCILSNNIYDSYTHRYFGEFLRFQRDYNGVDLMSMYNCNDGVYANNIKIRINENKVFRDGNEYKVYCFPVKFNRKYTIGMDCPTNIEIVVGLYNNGQLVNAVDSQYAELNEKLARMSYKLFASISMNRPVLYDNLVSSEIDEELYIYESLLTMFVKVPVSNPSSLVVLEGDYLDNFNINLSKQIFQHNILAFKDDNGKRQFYCPAFLSKIELMSNLNATSNYLLASRMVEYVTNNAICPLSQSYDIRKLQRRLVAKGLLNSDYYGVWRDVDRYAICQFITNNNLICSKYDMLSYLDKDAEQKMGDIE